MYVYCKKKLTGETIFEGEMTINFYLLEPKLNDFLPQTIIFLIFIFATRCCRPLIFQTMNSVRSKYLSLKGLHYQVKRYCN